MGPNRRFTGSSLMLIQAGPTLWIINPGFEGSLFICSLFLKNAVTLKSLRMFAVEESEGGVLSPGSGQGWGGEVGFVKLKDKM